MSAEPPRDDPPRYEVLFLPRALREFEKLPRDAQRAIGRRLDALERDPRPHGVKALSGQPGVLRVRVGDHRVLYRVTDETLEVLVVRVRHRRSVYDR